MEVDKIDSKIGLGALFLTVSLLMAPVVVADSGGELSPCPPVEEQELEKEIGWVGEEYHLNTVDDETSKLGLWRELNTWPGLQTEAGQCDYWGTIKSYPADIFVDSLSATGLV